MKSNFVAQSRRFLSETRLARKSRKGKSSPGKFRNQESQEIESGNSSEEISSVSSENEEECFEPNIVMIDFPKGEKPKCSINDFIIIALLGRGSFGRVVLAQNFQDERYYALKILDKVFIDRLKKQHEVIIEKNIFFLLNHPNIVKLHLTFQDQRKLYFALEYCSNRDLANLMNNYGNKMPIELIKFYTAEIVSALEYIHSKDVVHRDLKPENLVIKDNLHLKMTDFGNAIVVGKYFDKKSMRFVALTKEEEEEYWSKFKLLDEQKESTEIIFVNKKYQILDLNEEIVGTEYYVSPEMIRKERDKIGKGCDLWSLGIILYKLCYGKTPFEGYSKEKTFSKILKGKFALSNSVPKSANDLISNLLKQEPEERIGIRKGYEEIKNHIFFKGINFDNLYSCSPPVDKCKINPNKKYESLSISPEKKVNSINEAAAFYINLKTMKCADN